MESGQIKKQTTRGFGFIAGSDGRELFFHSSEVQGVTFDSLSEGQEVSFDRQADVKGPRARNVRPK
jgi:CspA family cold shock protein